MINALFFKQERDSLYHIFFKCEHADLFWKQLQDNVNDVCENAVSMTMNLSKTFVMFGDDGNQSLIPVFLIIFYYTPCKILHL
jgi:hypothetical protein